jgi:hypothetical protein
MKRQRIAGEAENVSQSVASTPFRARTYPVIPKSMALAAIQASNHTMEGNRSDARNVGREPARAARIIGTAKNTPTHHVARIPHPMPSRVGDCVGKIGG